MKHQKQIFFSIICIFILNSTAYAGENLIQNGSFEKHKGSKKGRKVKYVKMEHWSDRAEVWHNGFGRNATEGIYKIELDAGRKVDTLSQRAITKQGSTYKLSLDAYARRKNTSDFMLLVNGKVIATVTPNKKWKNYSAIFIADGTTQIITIKELAAQNNGLGAIIDNVKLEEVSTVTPPIEVDNIKPVITLKGSDRLVITLGDDYIDAGATAIDNVDGIIKVITNNNVNTSKIGTYKVIYTAKDLAKNIAVATRIVVVKAKVIVNQKPNVNAGSDKSFEVNKNFSFDAHATDSDGTIVSYVWKEGTKVLSRTKTLLFKPNKLGSHIFTITVKDNNNAISTDSVKITTVDTTKPVISLNGSVNMTLTLGDSYVDPSVTISDNYYKNIKVIKTGKVNTAKVGRYTITYNAIDGSTNKAVPVKRIVTVNKKVITPPTTVPGPVVDGIDNATLTLVANCAACHGMEKPSGVNEIPVIQGLGKTYLSNEQNYGWLQ